MKRTFYRQIALPIKLCIALLVSVNISFGQAPGTTTTPAKTNTPTGAGSILEAPNGGVLDGVYTPEHLPFRAPIPYVYEREADIMWSKRVWRAIDLREKMNHPLYFPEADPRRPSLWEVLKNGIYSGKIVSVFEFDITNYENGSLYTLAEASKQMTEDIALKDENGEPLFDANGTAVVKADTLRPNKIAQYYLKEDWFFDKQRSVMEARIISIAPVIESSDPTNGKFSFKPLFWIYFPAIRDYLAHYLSYNPYNDAEWRTFDDLFQKRLFTSYAVMESNVYDRSIGAYLPGQGMEQLLESERIKDGIFKYEHDMWHF